MTYTNLCYFLNGMCTMFFGYMTFWFWHKRSEALYATVAVFMALVSVGYLKDLPFIDEVFLDDEFVWQLITCSDMTVLPLYAAIVTELCKPGSLRTKRILIHEIPFVLLPLLLLFSKNEVFYHAAVIWGELYAAGYTVWALIAIPRYHKMLKEQFSYMENINLNWMRQSILSFFAMQIVWTLVNIEMNASMECYYMCLSLIICIFMCYSLSRHQSVLDELSSIEHCDNIPDAEDMPKLGATLQELFISQKLYLNPRLKLSDVAALAGTNRTYLSNYFNRTLNATFYDYVNGLRLNHAEELLQNSNEPQAFIAEQSGFNSLSTFRRQFQQRHHCTPEVFRQQQADSAK